MSASIVPPIQGIVSGVDGGLVPQIVKPIDIAVNLKNMWLFDPFFYSLLADLLARGYVTVGSGTLTFLNTAGKLTMTTSNLTGGSSQLATRQPFKIPNPLLKDNIFWRALVQVQNNAGGATRFAHVGLIQNPVEASTILANALSNMGDCIAFISSESQSSNNWTCMTQDGGVRTLTNTTVDSRNTVKKMECRSIANGSIEFLIDDVVVATHSTNVPVGSNVVWRCGNLALSNDVEVIDLFGLSLASSEPV